MATAAEILKRAKLLKEGGMQAVVMEDYLRRTQLAKGDKGDVGPRPTDQKLIALILPLIPKPGKGDAGHTPTSEEILALIRPLIPKVKNGETPSDERLLALIRPLIPAPDNTPEETPDEIVEKVNQATKKIKMSQIEMPKHAPNVPEIKIGGKGGGGGGGRTIEVWSGTNRIGQDIHKLIFEGSGVSIVRVSDGVAVLTVAAGAPTLSTEKLVPTASGDNATLDLTGLAHTFTAIQWIAKNGQVLDASDATFGWSRSSNTVTVLNAADTDIFLVSYSYAA